LKDKRFPDIETRSYTHNELSGEKKAFKLATSYTLLLRLLSMILLSMILPKS
jgi:hypothetical protein